MAATAVLPSGGRNLFPAAAPPAAVGGAAGTSSRGRGKRHNPLVHFRFNPEHKAERGRHGEGSNCSGREGVDMVLKVPVGTVLYDYETGALVHDFKRPD